MRHAVRNLLGIILLVLPACSGSQPDLVAEPAPSVSPSPSVKPVSAADAVLDGNGLGIVSFGDDERVVGEAMDSAFGSHGTARAACSTGAYDRIDRWGALQLRFKGTDLVGYSYSSSSSVPRGKPTKDDLRTEKGIGLGSSVDQIKAAYGEVRSESTIAAKYFVPTPGGEVVFWFGDVIPPPLPDGSPGVSGAILIEAGPTCLEE